MKYSVTEKRNIKAKLLIFGALIIICVFTFHIISYSAVVPGLNENGDDEKQKIETGVIIDTTIEGSFVDCNNNIISQAKEVGTSGTCLYNSYSTLIGYNDSSGAYGLKEKLFGYIYTEQKDGKGATVKLTTDNELQNYIYNLIGEINGSAVVLDNNSGKILALVSRNGKTEIDINKFHENYDEYVSAGFYTPNAIYDSTAPGSVFKIVTSAAIIENGKEDEVFYDSGKIELPGGGEICNYGNLQDNIKPVKLTEAFTESLNTYFANYGMKLGGKTLKDKASDFLIGKTIELDFAEINSTFASETPSSSECAMLAFGQGEAITPIHLAMIAQSIANDGKMLKPYLIDSIYLPDKALYSGKTEVLTEAVSAEAAKKIKLLMRSAAKSYSIEDEEIYAKTGTADLPSGYNRAVYLSFNEKYTVVLTESETTNFGISLQPYALDIYSYLDCQSGEKS